MRAQMIAVTAGLVACVSLACTRFLDLKPSSPEALPAVSPTELAKSVQQAMQSTQDTAPSREAARQKAFDAQRAQFEPSAKALYDAVKAGGVDVGGFLQASKAYAETPLAQRDPKVVDSVNAKYGPGIQSAIAKAVNLAGVGALLQQVQVPPVQPNEPTAGAVAASGTNCCTADRFQPPWEGLYSEGDFGSRAVRPGPTTQLAPSVRSAIVGAPHRLEQSGYRFPVSPATSGVVVGATLGTQWVIGLSGLGYAHVWLGLDMWVTKPDGTVVCRAGHVEQDNQWTWAGGFLTASDHRPGPTVIRSCRFDRVPGDPTEYVVNVSASADGTFIGFSGGSGDYFVDLGVVDVVSCQ